MEKEPRIMFKRSVIYNSGTHRVNIPTEIVAALKIKPKDKILCYLEGRKIVYILERDATFD